MILPDANILVYALNTSAPQHTVTRRLLQIARGFGIPIVLLPQVLLEFFSVCTQWTRVPNPLTADEAWREVATLRARYPLLGFGSDAFDHLTILVAAHSPTGRNIFDLFLAAQMLSHGVETICTYNDRDFAGIAGIEAVQPEEVLRRYGAL